MKKLLLTLAACAVTVTSLYAQTARSKALELHADLNAGSGDVRIYWPRDTTAVSYEVYFKLKESYSWTPIQTLPGSDSSALLNGLFLDHGFGKDFWVKKKWANDSASGYLHLSPDRYIRNNESQILLLVIDTNLAYPLAAEIQRFIKDLEQEYWEVHTLYAQRNDSVQMIKAWIENEWLTDSNRVKSLCLLGHVPVPYSGNINPDAHSDHQGAWPSDVYYVTFTMNWTDNQVNTTSASRSANHNVPGDGKFDQDYIWPAFAKIPVGRIDLYDMPAFGSDTLLTRRYLDKNHRFRTGQLQPKRRGLIDDNFGYFQGEAFAANGWRVFTPMFGDEVYTQDYFGSQLDSSFLFSYGCGSGTYTSASGIGSSGDFVTDSLLNPFTMLFGSYFGDWDNTDNYLRAPLASKGWGLASVWAGRPFWMFHHCAIGEPIGMAALQTQNAWPYYDAGYSGSYVHTALMGDPSLLLHSIKPLDSAWTDQYCAANAFTVYWSGDSLNFDTVLIQVYTLDGTLINQYKPRFSNGQMTLNLNQGGQYLVRVRAQTWLENPSGKFEVHSHAKELLINTQPAILVSIDAGPDTLCFGDTLFYKNTSTASGPYTWVWTLDGDTVSTADSAWYRNTEAGMHLLTLITLDSAGCIYSDSLPVYAIGELSLDSWVLESADGKPLCDSSNLTVRSASLSSLTNGLYTLLWGDGSRSSGSTINGEANELYTFAQSGNYTVMLILSDSTGRCSISDTRMLPIGQNPPKPVITPGLLNFNDFHHKDTLRAPYYPNLIYNWYNSGCQLLATDSVHKKVLDCTGEWSGIYSVALVLKNADSCRSIPGQAIVSLQTGVHTPDRAAWKLYPNPSQGRVVLEAVAGEIPEQVRVLDLQGKVILEIGNADKSAQLELNLSTLPPATYLIGGKVDGTWKYQRLILE